MRFFLLLMVVGCDAPQDKSKLSSYGLFTQTGGQISYAKDVVAYDLNTPLFSDYALKSRAVKLPKGKSAAYTSDGVFQFPVGTIVMKTFSFPADLRDPTAGVKLVETRLLIHEASGWTGVPYLWNAQQTEATLTPEGSMPTIDFLDNDGNPLEAHYLVPTEGQCKECHDAGGSFDVIGIKARQLNRELAGQNELASWSASGILSGAPDPSSAPTEAVWSDPATGSVAERARAWLDGNCAHCHNPTGLARTTGLFLDLAETDSAKLGLCKRPIAAGPGTGGFSFDIVPGDPDHSILIFRISSTDPGLMMPQIGRSVVHKEGVALMRDWISSLSGACQ
jgi:uncharacterized repeat protein (TIGR03806 family)